MLSKQYEQSIPIEIRKKAGVFYTPEYIIRFIIDETIGNWLNNRKKELKSELSSNNHLFWNKYFAILQNIKVLDLFKRIKQQIFKFLSESISYRKIYRAIERMVYA